MLMNVVLIFDEVHERVILSNFPDVVILEAFLVKRALDDSLLVQGLDAASAHGVTAGQRQGSLFSEIVGTEADVALIFFLSAL